MKYLYCLVTNPHKYYTEKIGAKEHVVSIHNAAVRNDPDDFILHRRELESHGYELVIMTDKEYFEARLRGERKVSSTSMSSS